MTSNVHTESALLRIPKAIVSQKVVIDGKFITSKGPGTAMDFALKLVEVFKGDQIVNSLRKAMIL